MAKARFAYAAYFAPGTATAQNLFALENPGSSDRPIRVVQVWANTSATALAAASTYMLRASRAVGIGGGTTVRPTLMRRNTIYRSNALQSCGSTEGVNGTAIAATLLDRIASVAVGNVLTAVGWTHCPSETLVRPDHELELAPGEAVVIHTLCLPAVFLTAVNAITEED